MRTLCLIVLGAAIGAAVGAMLPTRGLITGALIWPFPLACLFGCAGMPVQCPAPTVTAILCPDLPDYADAHFRAELAAEVGSLPSGTALGLAAEDYLSVAKAIHDKCGSA
jgi:hypothetical protein